MITSQKGTVARNSGPQQPPAVLICFSHLRWNFVFQRPQHLMRRAAHNARVFYWEEPLLVDASAPALDSFMSPEGVTVLTPLLPDGTDAAASIDAQRKLLDAFIAEHAIHNPVLWYYTPQALPFSAISGRGR